MTTQDSTINIEDYKNIMQFFYDFNDENTEKRSQALVWFYENFELVLSFPLYLSIQAIEGINESQISPHIHILELKDDQGISHPTYVIATYAFQPTVEMQEPLSNAEFKCINLELGKIIFNIFPAIQQKYENTIISISFPNDIHQQFFLDRQESAFISLFKDDIEILRKIAFTALSSQDSNLSEELWSRHLNHRQFRQFIYSFGLEHPEIEKIWCWGLGNILYITLDCPSSCFKQYKQLLTLELSAVIKDSELSLQILDLDQLEKNEIQENILAEEFSLFFQRTWNHFFLFRWWRNFRKIPLITVKDQ
ncbi:hypothetical protein GCM10025882_24900 [Acinetobacter gyllenbergii]|uniref:Uncharacterized protein n=1 Tax=Acinetobacter gyllenbergii CIP 110306 = MTCC 11365 TaxID=1217657 RepID=A0A829HHF7_9GAMM|nr:hypothetical protein [Acinetobacter gyllenbergii]EPF83422.1 hypothetical protein F957_01768 [Acinetobacter gyllenbergii CIP 110306 = MTCC 11365]EPH35498.1 hypothetical protein L293_0089 [Acinetobacter gyllenbergii CIP 110306 = MTCC 11365]ESK57741.1 hypothetical protein F987_00092 [Acinetobacter gyllenbergii NIPH 230]GMA12065.1 hypothetical protein GCM10025882_24900 [Acinetobacter gyllenbergii]